MPLSAVIHLEALNEGRLDEFTGRGVHGFWFRRWAEVNPAIADRLHEGSQEACFTLSPVTLADPLPGRRDGRGLVRAGQPAFMRVAILEEGLEGEFLSGWLNGLENGDPLEAPASREQNGESLPGIRWKVTGAAVQSGDHPLARQETYQELTRRCLMASNPPRQWLLEFLTPTTFHGKVAHLPFPLPESLINSWIRRWQTFAPLALPEEEMIAWARSNLAISAFSMRTLPVREGKRLRVGGVGTMTLRALDMPPYLRAAIDLLANYALYCGSGSHTTQGMGQTRLL
jgi:CRISPR-associated endoribonuclease Cas6